MLDAASETDQNHYKLNLTIQKCKDEITQWKQKVEEKLTIKSNLHDKLNLSKLQNNKYNENIKMIQSD